MWAFLLPLLLAIIYGSYYSLNSSNHWSQKASEQVRLDAITLSLCHSRLEFIRSEILTTNRRLTDFRRVLRTASPAAVAICSNPFTVSACAKARLGVKALALAAQAVEVRQNSKRLALPIAQRRLLNHLAKENAIEASRLETKSPLWSLSDGFQRERLSRIEQEYENYFSIRWPRRLNPAPDFEVTNTFSASYRPQRGFAGLKNRSKNAEVIEFVEVRESSPSVSRSECLVQANPFFQVRRTK